MVQHRGQSVRVSAWDPTPDAKGPEAGDGSVRAPSAGTVVAVAVAPGDAVEPETVVAVVEAMKLETNLKAGVSGVVEEVRRAVGTAVAAGDVLVVIRPNSPIPSSRGVSMSSDKAVVTCALTGVLTNPAKHPVPVTAEEMAASAREAFDAGATVMHVHLQTGARARSPPILGARRGRGCARCNPGGLSRCHHQHEHRVFGDDISSCRLHGALQAGDCRLQCRFPELPQAAPGRRVGLASRSSTTR